MVQQGANGAESGGGADVLENVELVSFTATPTQLGPFGASKLVWEVRGPQLGFFVRLNGATVARNGQEIVQPPQTATFRLSAVAAGATKFLGIVTVEVDTSACQITPLFNPEVAIRGFLSGQLGGRSDVTIQSEPSVIFSPGVIEFILQFGVAHGDATIAASLGLDVHGGHVVSETNSIYSDIDFSRWTQLASIFSGGVSKAMVDGKAAVAKAGQDLVTGLGEYVDLLAVVPKRFVKNSVSIGVDDQGHGTIDVQACPDDLLVVLSELSVKVSGSE
jgi:hypothetical protein